MPRTTPGGRPLRRAVETHSMPEVFAAVARGQIIHSTVGCAADFFGHPGIVWRPIADGEPIRSARSPPPVRLTCRCTGGSLRCPGWTAARR